MAGARQHRATFRFHGALHDFLPATSADAGPLVYRFSGTPSIKDAIEAQGVPHPEIAAILLAGRPVDFSYLLRTGDDVAVFPVGSRPELPAAIRLRPPLPAPPRFILDVNHEFFQCADCGKIYWSGSHAPGLNAKLERVLAAD